jgi:hypothetical protein
MYCPDSKLFHTLSITATEFLIPAINLRVNYLPFDYL